MVSHDEPSTQSHPSASLRHGLRQSIRCHPLRVVRSFHPTLQVTIYSGLTDGCSERGHALHSPVASYPSILVARAHKSEYAPPPPPPPSIHPFCAHFPSQPVGRGTRTFEPRASQSVAPFKLTQATTSNVRLCHSSRCSICLFDVSCAVLIGTPNKPGTRGESSFLKQFHHSPSSPHCSVSVQ